MQQITEITEKDVVELLTKVGIHVDGVGIPVGDDPSNWCCATLNGESKFAIRSWFGDDGLGEEIDPPEQWEQQDRQIIHVLFAIDYLVKTGILPEGEFLFYMEW